MLTTFKKRELAKFSVLKQMALLRQKIPKDEFNLESVAASNIREFNLDGRQVQRVIIYLRSSGCSWAAHPTGSCTMCGHWVGTNQGNTIYSDSLIQQFETEFSKYDFRNYPVLCLYNAGSFLSNGEISPSARINIFQKIAAEKNIKFVIIESRPEFITSEVIKDIRDGLPQRVQIGIGLETHSDLIRDLCINKGFILQDFENAVSIIKKGALESLAYVLFKPPFLTEQEAITESIKTIHYSFDLGVDAVSIEPVSIQSNTLVEALNKAGIYRVPWIWSIFKLLKETYRLGDVRAGGFEFFPPPSTVVHNCDRCNDSCYEAIALYNSEKTVSHFDSIKCDCKGNWEADTNQETEPLLDRIIIQTTILENYLEHNQFSLKILDKEIQEDDIQDFTKYLQEFPITPYWNFNRRKSQKFRSLPSRIRAAQITSGK